MAGDKLELTQADLDKKITEAVEKATAKLTEGLDKLKTKNTDLTGELKKSRKRVEDFADLDPVEVRQAVENAKDNERKAQQKRNNQPITNYRVNQHQTNPSGNNGMFNGRRSPGIGTGPVGPAFIMIVMWMKRKKNQI